MAPRPPVALWSSLMPLPLPTLDYRGVAALAGLLRDAKRQRVLLLTGGAARHLPRVLPELELFEVESFAEARRHVPKDLVERARAAFDTFGADAVVSVGGGSATGLGKALRLSRSFFFIAVPTTYAGSELTHIYGITSGATKQTGRDPRVLPDVALYDVQLTLDMPLGLSVTSLLNALAHPLSALSTGNLKAGASERALTAARAVYGALGQLIRDPRDVNGRRAALEGTVLAGQVLRESTVGLHHHMAHALGGRFDLDHAGLHSVLLPHFAAWMQLHATEAHDALRRRLGDDALAGTLFDILSRAGVPVSLAAMGLDEQAFRGFVATHPELPGDLLEAAFSGCRP
jgi:maleylacetate reductase